MFSICFCCKFLIRKISCLFNVVESQLISKLKAVLLENFHIKIFKFHHHHQRGHRLLVENRRFQLPLLVPCFRISVDK